MITKKDIDLLKSVFATKDDIVKINHDITGINDDITGIKGNITGIKDAIVEFKDIILKEIQAMREELIIISGYKDTLEDHEIRIEKLEKHSSGPT
jgi:predicted  nucleic acid-binding Zn-ribbon protein